MRYTLRHDIETDVDSYWRLFFDPVAFRSVVKDVYTYEVLEERADSSGILHRRVEFTFNVKLPDLLKKLFGDGSYVEIGRYDPKAKTYSAQQVPKKGADKFLSTVDIHLEPLGDKRCEQITVVDNIVKVFAIRSAAREASWRRAVPGEAQTEGPRRSESIAGSVRPAGNDRSARVATASVDRRYALSTTACSGGAEPASRASANFAHRLTRRTD